MTQESLKKSAALKALDYIQTHCLKDNIVLGVGTGSTVNYFIDALPSIKGNIESIVSSSKASTARLTSLGFRIEDLNHVSKVDVYVDGADEVNGHGQMIKGGGGALTSEKIIASMANKFIAIVDEKKKVSLLGHFPVAVEVIPMARSFVAREIVKLGGDPEYRLGFVTDHGNSILDVHNFKIDNALELERRLNDIAGVVCNGVFADRSADVVIVGGVGGVTIQEMV